MIDNSDLLKKVAERKIIRDQLYSDWWNSLSPSRQSAYHNLRTINSDVNAGKPPSKNNNDQVKQAFVTKSAEVTQFILFKCRMLLDLIDQMEDQQGNKITPVGIAIHGTVPVVFVQVGGQETKAGTNLNTVSLVPNFLKDNKQGIIKTSFDPNPFNIPATKPQLFNDSDITTGDWWVDKRFQMTEVD